jgi:hypothetical protein
MTRPAVERIRRAIAERRPGVEQTDRAAQVEDVPGGGGLGDHGAGQIEQDQPRARATQAAHRAQPPRVRR